ncbi:MAG: response regulator, partial [Phycisphaeraceae bacterium]
VTVLIADDEPHIRHLVGAKLKREGYNVLVASNGKDCLDLAREHRPALIVTDFQMPLLSGYEMSLALTEDQQTAGIPIILLTARGHKITPEELAKTGIKLVMDKPFGPTDLITKVQGMLDAAA